MFTLSPRDIKIKNAKLWWPRGYGESPLYVFEASLLSPDGKLLDSKRINVGLRTVNLKRSDVFKNGDKGEFAFYVNGRKIYIKGTNWVPLDALHSRDPQHLQKTLEMAVDLNCNMLRCWGGNVYESDAFYDFCDKNGILIWQDFSLACTTPPQDDDFAKAMEIEARSVVERLRHHPSLALWAGNNENDSSFYWLFNSNRLNIDPSKERISRKVLPEVLYELDPTRPYLPSSPYYSNDVFENKADPSEVHLWGPRGYYKAPFYTSSNAHFVSEIGYHGCPNRESLEKMFDKKHLYPWTDAKNLKWNKQWQAKAWWNLRDGWPILSDAITDYFFSKKLAYYYIKRVQENAIVAVNDALEVIAVNDTFKPAEGKVEISDIEGGKVLFEADFKIPPNGKTLVGNVSGLPSERGMLLIKYEIDGKKQLNHYLYGKPPFDLKKYREWAESLAIKRD